MRLFLKYPPLFLGVHLIIGILLGKFYGINFSNAIYICVLGLLVFVLILRLKIRITQFQERMLFGGVMLFIGASCFSITDIRNNEHFFVNELAKNSDERLIVEVKEVLKSTKAFDRFVIEVKQVNEKPTLGNVLFYVRKDSTTEMSIGNRYVCRTAIQEIATPKNPFEFNYAAYLENQNLYHQMFVASTDLILLERNTHNVIYKLREFRSNLIYKLEENGFKNDVLAVMSALLLGDKKDVSVELKNAYIDAGAIHILAISGLHIGILFLMISSLLKPLGYLKYGKELSQILILLLLWLFAILAGMSASVVRAVTMFSAVSIGMFLNRKNSVYHSLITSAFILLLIRPQFLFEVGFQLSYAAVVSIVWLQPKLEGLCNPRFKSTRYVWKLFTVSLAAQLGVLPLSLYYFHQFPGLFFVSNLVVIPLLGSVLCVGLIVLILTFFEVEFSLLFELYAWLIHLLNTFIKVVSDVDIFVLDGIYWSVGLLVSAYILLLCFFKWREKQNNTRFGLAIAAICFFYGVLIVETVFQKNQKEIVVFHKTKETIYSELRGNKLHVFGIHGSRLPSFLKTYQTNMGVKNLEIEPELPILLNSKEAPIVVVDSLGLYGYKSVLNPILLLKNSPKINFERLIKIVKPRYVIADGSNYRSVVARWKRTALETKTPFHDTSQKGAFILKND